VLTRTIEPGQTVAASLQAPVLFQLAEDLSKMEILLAIDEADIGQVKPGQAVSFSVDAFPDRQFRGNVQQVRLSATNTNNVITYPVVVAVDNSDRTLLPGMTANAEIEVSRRDDVLRVPNSALRYKPDEDATNPEASPSSGRSARMADELPAIAQRLQLGSEQRAAFDAALAGLQARTAQRRTQPATPSRSAGSSLFGRGPQPSRNSGNDKSNQGAMRQRMLERLNQQFAAFRATLNPSQQQQWDRDVAALAAARRAPLYVLVDGKPTPVTARVGASDGTNTEVSGDIHAGDKVVVGSERAAASP
jgi:HlyD family secretion protein